MLQRTALAIGLLVLAATATAGDWPFWMGPRGDGSGIDCGKPLVESMDDAVVLWKSEQKLPDGRAPDGSEKVQSSVSGGFASPVLAGDRLYFFYYVPSGQVHDKALAARGYAYENGVTKDKWLIDADDIVICIDARTGKTLWKTVFEQKGINFGTFNKGGPMLTPAVADGKVYALGTMGRVYCLDAATGKPLWESNIGERFERQVKLKQVAKEQKMLPQFNRDFAVTLTVADGVVVCSDVLSYKVQTPVREFFWSHQSGMVGLDGKTGQRLWALPATLGLFVSPVRWTHGGREYVIGINRGKATCADPKTGKVVWELEVGANGETPAISGDYLLCNGAADGEGALTCYKLDPSGGKKLWAMPAGFGYPRSTPVVYEGHVYACGRSGKMACIEIATGKVVGALGLNAGGASFAVAADRRLLVQADAAHGKAEVYYIKADPHDLRQLGDVWQAPAAPSYTTAAGRRPPLPACA